MAQEKSGEFCINGNNYEVAIMEDGARFVSLSLIPSCDNGSEVRIFHSSHFDPQGIWTNNSCSVHQSGRYTKLDCSGHIAAFSRIYEHVEPSLIGANTD